MRATKSRGSQTSDAAVDRGRSWTPSGPPV